MARPDRGYLQQNRRQTTVFSLFPAFRDTQRLVGISSSGEQNPPGEPSKFCPDEGLVRSFKVVSAQIAFAGSDGDERSCKTQVIASRRDVPHDGVLSLGSAAGQYRRPFSSPSAFTSTHPFFPSLLFPLSVTTPTPRRHGAFSHGAHRLE